MSFFQDKRFSIFVLLLLILTVFISSSCYLSISKTQKDRIKKEKNLILEEHKNRIEDTEGNYDDDETIKEASHRLMEDDLHRLYHEEKYNDSFQSHLLMGIPGLGLGFIAVDEVVYMPLIWVCELSSFFSLYLALKETGGLSFKDKNFEENVLVTISFSAFITSYISSIYIPYYIAKEKNKKIFHHVFSTNDDIVLMPYFVADGDMFSVGFSIR